MLKRALKITLALSVTLLLAACNGDAGKENKAAAADSLKVVTPPAMSFSDVKGFAGVFDVPEMLALCKLDSAPVADVPAKIKSSFEILAADFKEIEAVADGPQGAIYYNNNPANFKFECLLLMKGMPAKTPKHSKIVVLEADRMLIYNHYGSYESSFKAYEAIQIYCKEHLLKPSGPMREFYPTSVSEPDTAKWLTRIMVPVMVDPVGNK